MTQVVTIMLYHDQISVVGTTMQNRDKQCEKTFYYLLQSVRSLYRSAFLLRQGSNNITSTESKLNFSTIFSTI